MANATITGGPDYTYQITAGGAYTSGQILLRDTNIVVVYVGLKTCASGDAVAVSPCVEGVFPAKAADDWAEGAFVYWDNANSHVTDTATDMVPLGYAVATKAASATTCKIKMVERAGAVVTS